MSETSTTTDATETVAEDTPAPEAEQLPADHPLVKTLAAQKQQIRELKAKASRLDEIEEAQKTEAEKMADRLAKADAAIADIPAQVAAQLKAFLVERYEVTPEDAEVLLTATEPELLIKQFNRLVGPDKRGNVVPREGRNPNPAPADPTRDFLRHLNGQ